MFCQHYPFVLPPLPYAYDALEPYISVEILRYHHDKHFRAYVNNLNQVLTACPLLQELTLAQLLRQDCSLPRNLRNQILNNAGGVFSHDLYFNLLSPPGEKSRLNIGSLIPLIDKNFKTFENFKNLFSESASSLFGSGWTYLVQTHSGKLKIINYPNQQTPISDGFKPLMLIDVWEHAYYLEYKNDRNSYIQGFWSVIGMQ